MFCELYRFTSEGVSVLLRLTPQFKTYSLTNLMVLFRGLQIITMIAIVTRAPTQNEINPVVCIKVLMFSGVANVAAATTMMKPKASLPSQSSHGHLPQPRFIAQITRPSLIPIPRINPIVSAVIVFSFLCIFVFYEIIFVTFAVIHLIIRIIRRSFWVFVSC